MGSEFQDLFKRGTTAWAIKYFKEEILTSLVDDLATKNKTGIEEEICTQIREALRNTAASVTNRDGSFMKKNFKQRLGDYLEIYTRWNDARTELERRLILDELRERKNQIFEDFYNYIDELAKSKDSRKNDEYWKLLSRESEININLSKSLQQFVDKNQADFPRLYSSLSTYNKRNDVS